MNVKVLEEAFYKVANHGLGLSFGKTDDIPYEEYNDISDQEKVMRRLSGKGNGHDKFLRQIQVALEIEAPLYWWSEMDTYGVGVTKQSASTMHTLGKKRLEPEDFEGEIPLELLIILNNFMEQFHKYKNEGNLEKAIYYWMKLKQCLPASFLQKRDVTCNYMVLQNIIRQRKGHKLPEWKIFIDSILNQVQHPELLGEKPMPKFNVTVKDITFHWYSNIEANSKQEAEEIALSLFEKGENGVEDNAVEIDYTEEVEE